ncbi:hypothetical protein GWN26_01345 [Candidatus Saccharibacteria bacterium]|nr:hypothetical protein [Candidatus Saccharibacteria bacterium]
MDHFSGCLVVVSHDRYFLDRTVDFFATFENGSFSPRYPAPYSAYQAARQSLKESRAEPEKSASRSQKQEARSNLEDEQPRKLTWKEARELEELEETIARLEAKKAEIGAEINRAGGDYEQLQNLTESLRIVEVDLENAMVRWVELSELN